MSSLLPWRGSVDRRRSHGGSTSSSTSTARASWPVDRTSSRSCPDAAIAVTGEGAPLVSANLIDRGGRPLVLLRAVEPPEGRETTFQLSVAYGNGEEDKLNFFVVAKKTPSNVRAERMLEGGIR